MFVFINSCLPTCSWHCEISHLFMRVARFIYIEFSILVCKNILLILTCIWMMLLLCEFFITENFWIVTWSSWYLSISKLKQWQVLYERCWETTIILTSFRAHDTMNKYDKSSLNEVRRIILQFYSLRATSSLAWPWLVKEVPRSFFSVTVNFRHRTAVKSNLHILRFCA